MTLRTHTSLGSRAWVAAVATAVATAALAVPASAATAAPTITIRPGALTRGPDPAIPYVNGDVLVHGARRVPLPASSVLIGRSAGAYLVWTSDGASTPRIWRVRADGDATLLLRSREAYGAVLSAEGDQLLVPRTRVQARETVLSLRDADTGALEEQLVVPGFANVLDLDDDVAVVGTTSPARTFRWDVGTGERERLSNRAGYQADLSADRLAVLTDDPYDGGCSIVSSLSDPTAVLSESCTERVTDFSPDGRRLALVDLLTDGLGPNRVIVRTAGGRRVSTYDAPFFFGLVTWETSRALLLQTNGTSRSALVRCTRAHCERASRLGPPPAVRAPAAAFRLPGQPGARP